MIFVNLDTLSIPANRQTSLDSLTAALIGLGLGERAPFIEANRPNAWAHVEVLTGLRNIVGNKCWYTEVHLEGADPNVDHFRPKGRVREIDDELKNTGETSEGYWWLAFELRNYRLACMHANQRRVDLSTDGGKWDYFPVRGGRAASGTPWGAIVENVLPLDPCSMSDVGLLWFDPDGKPGSVRWRHRAPGSLEDQRVRISVWLYHLDKVELQSRRAAHVEDIRKDLRKAHIEYYLWSPDGATPNLQAKNSFDEKIAEIRSKIADSAEFAGAKRCAVRAAMAEYPWLEEVGLV